MVTTTQCLCNVKPDYFATRAPGRLRDCSRTVAELGRELWPHLLMDCSHRHTAGGQGRKDPQLLTDSSRCVGSLPTSSVSRSRRPLPARFKGEKQEGGFNLIRLLVEATCWGICRQDSTRRPSLFSLFSHRKETQPCVNLFYVSIATTTSKELCFIT